MSMIIPRKQNKTERVPTWLNVGTVLDASKDIVNIRKNAVKKTASKKQDRIVTRYGCDNCNKSYNADNKLIVSQIDLAKRANKLDDLELRCPCGNGLVVKQTIPRIGYDNGGVFADTDTVVKAPLAKESGYNTYVDRHFVYKALDALTQFSAKAGMTKARARFLRSEHKKETGHDYPTLSTLHCEIDWLLGKGPHYQDVANRVFASVTIDPSGKITLPTVFKDAAGKEHPFIKESIEKIRQSADRVRMHSPHKPRKTDLPTYRERDPSRFRTVASGNQSFDASDILNDLVTSQDTGGGLEKKSYNVTPPAPVTMGQPGQQFQPEDQVYNPTDGKTYRVMQQDHQSVTVFDDDTQQELVVPNDQIDTLKPVVRTSVTKDDIVRDVVKNVTSDLSNLGVPSTKSKFIPVESKDKRWAEIRNDIAEKLSKDNQNSENVSKNKQITKAAATGFNPRQPDKDKTGHDRATNLPFTEEKDIEVGLTEFPKGQNRDDGPGYTIPFQEMDENHVEQRERFNNEKRLPIRMMQRHELKKLIEGDDDYNAGLAREEKLALLDSLLMTKLGYDDGDGIVKTAQGDPPPTDDPAQTPSPAPETAPTRGPVKFPKPLKKKSPRVDEPEFIPDAVGGAKEAITKLLQAQGAQEELMREIEQKIAVQKGEVKKLEKEKREIEGGEEYQQLKETYSKYLELTHGRILEQDKRGVLKYAADILAALETRTKIPTIPQEHDVRQAVIAALGEKADEVFKKVDELRNAMTTYETVIARELVQYPAAGPQKKKTKGSIDTDILKTIAEGVGSWVSEYSELMGEITAYADILEQS